MAAPKGNRFWEARSTHGRSPIFASPEALWTCCLEYFEWVEANPLYERKSFMFQGSIVHDDVPKMRAMSIAGICNFLDIATVTWRDYASKDGFSTVTSRAESLMRQQKFEGASADMLNANIIARDLGLADKTELSGRDGGPIKTHLTLDASRLSDSTLAELMAARDATESDGS